eukprot:ctg_2997.g468
MRRFAVGVLELARSRHQTGGVDLRRVASLNSDDDTPLASANTSSTAVLLAGGENDGTGTGTTVVEAAGDGGGVGVGVAVGVEVGVGVAVMDALDDAANDGIVALGDGEAVAVLFAEAVALGDELVAVAVADPLVAEGVAVAVA